MHADGEQHRERQQHQGRIQPQHDAAGETKQGGMTQGVSEEGQLTEHREAAEHAAESPGQQPRQERPLQRGQGQQIQPGRRIDHQLRLSGGVGAWGWAWRWLW